MSGRTIGSIVGFAIGSMFGAPQLGMFLGSMVGGALKPDVIQGNKVGEIPVQRSQTGGVQPVVLGTSLVDKTNVMCQSAVRIRKEKTEQGKGGGPVVENEVAYQDYTIRVCRSSAADGSQVQAFVMVFEDGKLVYDARPTPRISAAESAKWKANVTFYYGGEAQGVDPTEESIDGVGNVSAHRQIARMVFTNKNITDFGNRIPTYEVVVSRCAAESAGTDWRFLAVGSTADGIYSGVRPIDSSMAWYGDDDIAGTGTLNTSPVAVVRYGTKVFAFNRYNSDNDVECRVADISAIDTWAAGPTIATVGGPLSRGHSGVFGGRLWIACGSSGLAWIDDAADASFTYETGMLSLIPLFKRSVIGVTGNESNVLCMDGLGAFYKSGDYGGSWSAGADIFGSGNRFYTSYGALDSNGGRAVVGGGETALRVAFTDNNGTSFTESTVPTAGVAAQVKYVGNDRWLIACRNGSTTTNCLVKSVDDGATFTAVTLPVALNFSQQSNQSIAVDGTSLRVVICGDEVGTGARKFYWSDDLVEWTEIPVASETTMSGVVDSYPIGNATITYTGDELPDAPGYYIDKTTGAIDGPNLATSSLCGTTLADVVQYITRRAQLDDAEVDVTTLTGIPVRGITLQSTGSCKDELSPLQLAHFFDPSDFDGKLRFRLRGESAVDMIINPDHLILTEDEDQQDALDGQDVEYPRRNNLNYLCLDLDYIRTVASESRTAIADNVVGASDNSINEVMTSQEAQEVTAIQLKQAWMAREGSQKFGLPLEYLQIVGASLVSLGGKRMRIDGYMIEPDGIWIDPAAYDRASAATANVVAPELTAPGAPPSSLRGPTDAVLMNAPVLADANDKPGLTWAASGYPNTRWQGARLQVQRGSEWVTLGDITQACGMGELLDGLPAFDGTYDTVNTLHVRLNEDIDSTTFAAQMQEGNPIAIPYADGTVEILQPRDVVESSPGVYACTNLIRARNDTVNGSHAAGDRVVVIDSRLGFAHLRRDDLGKTLTFRAVSIGTDPDAAPTQTITLTTMESQREWQPWNVEWEPDGSCNVRVTFVGRHRLGTDQSPVASQWFKHWRIDFLAGGITKSRTTTEESFTYTAEMQEVDFGRVVCGGFTAVRVVAVNEYTGTDGAGGSGGGSIDTPPLGSSSPNTGDPMTDPDYTATWQEGGAFPALYVGEPVQIHLNGTDCRVWKGLRIPTFATGELVPGVYGALIDSTVSGMAALVGIPMQVGTFTADIYYPSDLAAEQPHGGHLTDSVTVLASPTYSFWDWTWRGTNYSMGFVDHATLKCWYGGHLETRGEFTSGKVQGEIVVTGIDSGLTVFSVVAARPNTLSAQGVIQRFHEFTIPADGTYAIRVDADVSPATLELVDESGTVIDTATLVRNSGEVFRFRFASTQTGYLPYNSPGIYVQVHGNFGNDASWAIPLPPGYTGLANAPPVVAMMWDGGFNMGLALSHQGRGGPLFAIGSSSFVGGGLARSQIGKSSGTWRFRFYLNTRNENVRLGLCNETHTSADSLGDIPDTVAYAPPAQGDGRVHRLLWSGGSSELPTGFGTMEEGLRNALPTWQEWLIDFGAGTVTVKIQEAGNTGALGPVGTLGPAPLPSGTVYAAGYAPSGWLAELHHTGTEPGYSDITEAL